jgi:hypothetical protein
MGPEYIEKKRRESCFRTIALAACVGIIFGLTATAIIKTYKFYYASEGSDLQSAPRADAEGKQPAAIKQTKERQNLKPVGNKLTLECHLQKHKVLHGKDEIFTKLPKVIVLSIDPRNQILRLGALTGLPFERTGNIISFKHSPDYLQKVQFNDIYTLNTLTGNLMQKITIPLNKPPGDIERNGVSVAIYESTFYCTKNLTVKSVNSRKIGF